MLSASLAEDMLSKQHADRGVLQLIVNIAVLQSKQATNVLCGAQQHQIISKFHIGMLQNTIADLQKSRHVHAALVLPSHLLCSIILPT